ncbi:hypothetical protein EEL32_06580 [Brevibacillus laterosporus]|uniref:Uncharacterized protein n=1 Tax=Brevibacillus laterosporus TaxID=1465 RepID=A0A502IUJ8_BRELA|nr:hypothetical protein [Brevibacillus laterosporus]QDX94141.1 hypothetical protein EEL30_18740 [Brevibacillus laterosporus]RAP29414.1 hypothetical protein C2W64_03763 [Brevibacillus laterosporus]TPG89126.1 hypothetical protein EEL32_06580 [Brevibacillus laterosporus]
MTNLIVESRWVLLIVAEITFWLLFLSFLLFRYLFQKSYASKISLVLLLLNEIWIIGLGIIDYIQTGVFSIYQIVIGILLLYAVTYGKQDAIKVDMFLRRKIAAWKGEPWPTLSEDIAYLKNQLYGWDHTKKELIGFAKHALLFAFAHLSVFIYLWVVNQDVMPAELSLLDKGKWIIATFTSMKQLNAASGIWSTILFIDGLITSSYIFSPKKPTKNNENM